jgi:ATP-binding cassette subfamily B protein
MGEMSLGQFFSLLFYSFFIFNPLGEFGNLSSAYQEVNASLEVLEEVLRAPPEAKPVHAVDPGLLRAIAFKNVSFFYSGVSLAAVKNIRFMLRGGETAAFVGPSGSGKTTLVKLLVGLYRPATGSVFVNGVSGEKIDYGAFRKHIGYVSQETQLFAGTVRENLLFVNPRATDGECMTALRQASALSIVERARLPASPERERGEPASQPASPSLGGRGEPDGQGGQGLDTKIGEGGIKVSGGERQRLAIARALLRNPELIIFDEATSSLDSITEKAVAKTIREIASSRPNLITVLVAHRLSTIAHADAIYVLEKGRITEQGIHNTLLKKRGLYAALWREQSAA